MMSRKIAVIGTNGQISLGKKHAGETVMIDQTDEGSWIIHTGKFIPDSEKWLYADLKNLAKLDKAIEWTEKHSSTDNFDTLIKEFERVAKNKNRSK